jgi:hypothetical protein
MRRIFNPCCCITQGGTQVRDYASLYPYANVFRRLEQCHDETRTVISCGSRECCLSADSTYACHWEGHVCLSGTRAVQKLTRYHARTGGSVPTDIHQASWLASKLIHFTDHVTRWSFCTPVVRVTGKRHFLDLVMLCTIRLCAYF